jgi:hypothetical protein
VASNAGRFGVGAPYLLIDVVWSQAEAEHGEGTDSRQLEDKSAALMEGKQDEKTSVHLLLNFNNVPLINSGGVPFTSPHFMIRPQGPT